MFLRSSSSSDSTDAPIAGARRFVRPAVLSGFIAAFAGLAALQSDPNLAVIILMAACASIGWVMWLERRQIMPQASKMAKPDPGSPTIMLRHLSHELRTPLGIMLGYSELLASEQQDAEVSRDCVQAIRRSGSHLVSIVDDLLEYAALEANETSPVIGPCDLSSLVTEVEHVMKPKAQSRNLEFHLHIDADAASVSVQTDGLRLRRVLMHLVDNAIKFTDVGAVRVQLRMLAQDQSRQVQIIITDTGPGPGHLQERWRSGEFVPMTMGDGSYQRRHGGLGMGLALSAMIIRRLGGTLRIGPATALSNQSATQAIGTECTVELLCKVVGAAEQEFHPTIEHAPIGLSGRVLLAAGDADMRTLLQRHLQSAGLEVELVNSGRAAADRLLAAMFRGQPFDAAIFAEPLGELSASGAASLLRQCGVPHPLVAIGSTNMSADRDRCLSAGFDLYLASPIERFALLVALERYIKPETRGSLRRAA